MFTVRQHIYSNILLLLTFIRIESTYLTINLRFECDSNYHSSYSSPFILFFLKISLELQSKLICRFNTDFTEHTSSMIELILLDPALNTKHQLRRVTLHLSSRHTNILLSAICKVSGSVFILELI